MIALERRQPAALPPDWASLRAGWPLRLQADPGARAEYRSCYLVLTTEEDERAKTVPPPHEEPAPDTPPGEDVPMPLVERVMASFQLDLPTSEIERPVLADFDPDQTQMARVPDGPALPFREGAAAAPAALPIETADDAGATVAIDELKAQVAAIRRVHEMTVEEYARLRAALVVATENGGKEAEQPIWLEARIPTAADQERLRQRFFDLFQRDPSQRGAFESVLRSQIVKLRDQK
jgi:hypothetical protein